MAFDWNDYITVSQSLIQNADEGSMRTSISRSYYALYNQTYEKLVNEGEQFTNASLHTQTWNKLIQSSDSNRQYLGVLGRRLKRNRQDADYKKNIKITNNLVRQVLNNAQRAISLLQII